MQENLNKVPQENDSTTKPENDLISGLTVLGKIQLPVRSSVADNEKKDDSKENSSMSGYGNADAMTEDFGRSMSRSSRYNDDLDTDQQSQEYWDSI